MIRDHLLRVGEDYPYNIWREFCEIFRRAFARGELGNIRRFPSAISIANILRCCERLGLVEETRREPSPLRGGERMFKWRKYYRVVKPNAWEWENPITAYYDPERFRSTRYTKRPLAVLGAEEREEVLERLRDKMKERLREGYEKLLRTGWRPRGKRREVG